MSGEHVATVLALHSPNDNHESAESRQLKNDRKQIRINKAWQCPCTMVNSSRHRRCIICNYDSALLNLTDGESTAAVRIKEEPQRYHEVAHQINNHKDFAQNDEGNRSYSNLPSKVIGDTAEAKSMDGEFWKCDKCTLVNKVKSRSCEACGSKSRTQKSTQKSKATNGTTNGNVSPPLKENQADISSAYPSKTAVDASLPESQNEEIGVSEALAARKVDPPQQERHPVSEIYPGESTAAESELRVVGDGLRSNPDVGERVGTPEHEVHHLKDINSKDGASNGDFSYPVEKSIETKTSDIAETGECPQCTYKNPKGFRFCDVCGYALDFSTLKSPTKVRRSVSKKPQKEKMSGVESSPQLHKDEEGDALVSGEIDEKPVDAMTTSSVRKRSRKPRNSFFSDPRRKRIKRPRTNESVDGGGQEEEEEEEEENSEVPPVTSDEKQSVDVENDANNDVNNGDESAKPPVPVPIIHPSSLKEETKSAVKKEKRRNSNSNGNANSSSTPRSSAAGPSQQTTTDKQSRADRAAEMQIIYEMVFDAPPPLKRGMVIVWDCKKCQCQNAIREKVCLICESKQSGSYHYVALCTHFKALEGRRLKRQAEQDALLSGGLPPPIVPSRGASSASSVPKPAQPRRIKPPIDSNVTNVAKSVRSRRPSAGLKAADPSENPVDVTVLPAKERKKRKTASGNDPRRAKNVNQFHPYKEPRMGPEFQVDIDALPQPGHFVPSRMDYSVFYDRLEDVESTAISPWQYNNVYYDVLWMTDQDIRCRDTSFSQDEFSALFQHRKPTSSSHPPISPAKSTSNDVPQSVVPTIQQNGLSPSVSQPSETAEASAVTSNEGETAITPVVNDGPVNEPKVNRESSAIVTDIVRESVARALDLVTVGHEIPADAIHNDEVQIDAVTHLSSMLQQSPLSDEAHLALQCLQSHPVLALKCLMESNYNLQYLLTTLPALIQERAVSRTITTPEGRPYLLGTLDMQLLTLEAEELSRFREALVRYGNEDWNNVVKALDRRYTVGQLQDFYFCTWIHKYKEQSLETDRQHRNFKRGRLTASSSSNKVDTSGKPRRSKGASRELQNLLLDQERSMFNAGTGRTLEGGAAKDPSAADDGQPFRRRVRGNSLHAVVPKIVKRRRKKTVVATDATTSDPADAVVIAAGLGDSMDVSEEEDGVDVTDDGDALEVDMMDVDDQMVEDGDEDRDDGDVAVHEDDGADAEDNHTALLRYLSATSQRPRLLSRDVEDDDDNVDEVDGEQSLSSAIDEEEEVASVDGGADSEEDGEEIPARNHDVMGENRNAVEEELDEDDDSADGTGASDEDGDLESESDSGSVHNTSVDASSYVVK